METKTNSQNAHTTWKRQQFITYKFVKNNQKSTVYSSGISISPARIPSRIAEGCFSSIVQPTDCAVPRTSFTVPERVFAIDRGLIARATLMIDSRETSPRCFTEKSTRSNPCLLGHLSESPRTMLFAQLKDGTRRKATKMGTEMENRHGTSGSWLTARTGGWVPLGVSPTLCRTHRFSISFGPVECL